MSNARYPHEPHSANYAASPSEVLKSLTPDFLQRAGEALVNAIRPLMQVLSSSHEVRLSGTEIGQDHAVACCGMPTCETPNK